MPASGRDLLSRLVTTSVVTCSVSPWNTGLGNFTSVMPRLPMVVPMRRVVDGDADHDAQREEAVDQRLAPLGLAGELVVDVQRLRVVRQAGEQRVVHLRDGAAHRVLERRARPRSPPDKARACASSSASIAELLGQDALVQAVAGIEHHEQVDVRWPAATSTCATERVSAWSATALTGRLSASSTSKRMLGLVRQQRAAPAPRPERR